MSEPLISTETAPTPFRPFPWYCPRCRRKEVERTTIAYQCQRVYQGKPITVVVADLAVPKCGNCGELVFDYVAEEQINRAFQTQSCALGNGWNGDGDREQRDEAKAIRDCSG